LKKKEICRKLKVKGNSTSSACDNKRIHRFFCLFSDSFTLRSFDDRIIFNDDLKGMRKGAAVAYFTVNSAWMNEETSEKISVRLAYL
jgi:hypothetical protein